MPRVTPVAHRPLRRWLPLLCLLAAAPTLALDLQGHRGARGLAPENTLAGFDRALEIGVSTLELDVGLTADGVVVVAHDRRLNPAITRDAQGRWLQPGATPRLRELTLPQLQAYEVGRLRPGTAYAASFPHQQPADGARIPTLAALFAQVRARGAQQVRFNIETKLDPTRPEDTADPASFVDAVLATVRAAGMERRVSIQSFDWRTLRRVQQQAPAIPTVYLSLQSGGADTIADGRWTDGLRLADHGSVPAMVRAAGGHTWSPNAAALTPVLLRQAHALGLRVVPWTVNDVAEMERLIDWGVDGLITDYPDRLREVMRHRRLPLPLPAPG